MSEKILDRVRKMLDLANHPSTGEAERETFLARANELMVKHAIDEALLAATLSPSERRTPVVETVEMYERHSVHSQRFDTILSEICRTVRVRAAKIHDRSSDYQKITLVGFRDDVEYAQLLFTTVQFAYIAKVKPEWSSELPVGQNVYNFKVAGYDWTSIYATARRNGVECDQERETLWSPYDTYVRRNGLTKIKTNRFGAYRDSFAEGFVERICSRLEDMRSAGAEQAAGSGAELALVHRTEEVNEEFYRHFPHRRPMSDEDAQRLRAEMEEQDRKQREALAARLAAMTPRERAAYEREQQEKRQRKAREDAKYWRQLDAEQARKFDSAGRRAGTAAAESVNLTRPGTSAEAASSRKAL